MLGGWHSGPADSNYHAKQSVKRVSPHQSEEVDLWSDRCGMISALFHASGVCCDGGGVASTGRAVHTKPVCADLFIKKRKLSILLVTFFPNIVYAVKLHVNFSDLSPHPLWVPSFLHLHPPCKNGQLSL